MRLLPTKTYVLLTAINPIIFALLRRNCAEDLHAALDATSFILFVACILAALISAIHYCVRLFDQRRY